MKALYITFATVTTLVLLGCGGGSGSTTNNTTNNLGNNTNNENPSIGNTEGGNIESRLENLSFAKDLVSGTDKKVCQNIDENRSYTLTSYLYSNNLSVDYKKYSQENCLGAVTWDRAKYRVNYGNTLNSGKAIEIDIQFVSGDDLTEYDMAKRLLGSDIATTYYTTLVSTGEFGNKDIVWAVAKASDSNDGTSANKRANDISDYTSKKYYFAQ